MTLSCAVLLLAVPSHVEVLQVEQRQSVSGLGTALVAVGGVTVAAPVLWLYCLQVERQWWRGSGSGTRTCLASAMAVLSICMLPMARQRVAQLQKH